MLLRNQLGEILRRAEPRLQTASAAARHRVAGEQHVEPLSA